MLHLILALVAVWQVTGAVIRHHDATHPCHHVQSVMYWVDGTQSPMILMVCQPTKEK